MKNKPLFSSYPVLIISTLFPKSYELSLVLLNSASHFSIRAQREIVKSPTGSNKILTCRQKHNQTTVQQTTPPLISTIHSGRQLCSSPTSQHPHHPNHTMSENDAARKARKAKVRLSLGLWNGLWNDSSFNYDAVEGVRRLLLVSTTRLS